MADLAQPRPFHAECPACRNWTMAFVHIVFKGYTADPQQYLYACTTADCGAVLITRKAVHVEA